MHTHPPSSPELVARDVVTASAVDAFVADEFVAGDCAAVQGDVPESWEKRFHRSVPLPSRK